MALHIDAACFCHMGKVRKNNEDNFFFDDRCLEAVNNGLKHPVTMSRSLRRELCIAVFDGMGGENYGELASFAAAESMKSMSRKLMDYFIPEREFLTGMCMKINNAVVAKKQEMCTEHMGTTMALLYFSHGYVYVCNLGDSRAYRLRDGEFLQITEDHVEKRDEKLGRKAPLTQHLGIDPEEMIIEPHIAKGELRRGDIYLICSDGLTDMLTNLEIDDILSRSYDMEECARSLVDSALEKGGRDNVTVIVCRVF